MSIVCGSFAKYISEPLQDYLNSGFAVYNMLLTVRNRFLGLQKSRHVRRLSVCPTSDLEN